MHKIDIKEVVGNTDVPINQLTFDSRKIVMGDVFFALNGVAVDGHRFIEKAIDLGANSIVCERLPTVTNKNVTYLKVADSQITLAKMAANYYENPSQKLALVGVTGTNGKTTVASLLFQLFKKAGYKVGLLSTVKIWVDDLEFNATHTTPDSITINQYLERMVQKKVAYCFMEVSSHGIHQKRTEGLSFAGGIFTNLTHDHLDYHKTFATYRDVKKSFFDNLPKTAFALTNLDDKNGLVMLQNTKATKKTYALKIVSDFKGKIIEKQFLGTLITINGMEVWTKLIGEFNVYNLLAIYGTAELLGLEKVAILTIISELESVSGRFQYSVSENGIIAIIDYAHTPDALKNVLETINDIRSGKGNVITVVGCGGNRDRTKRPKMARIAAQLSHRVIFTSDNPRDENPQAIINEMEAGVSKENDGSTLSNIDRRQAIKTAYQLANEGDIILIAGKGHEIYQEINGERNHFDDYEEIMNLFNQLKKV